MQFCYAMPYPVIIFSKHCIKINAGFVFLYISIEINLELTQV